MIAYAITDSTTLNFKTLKADMERFSKKATMIVYRDKNNKDYALNAKDFLQEAKKHKLKSLLHTDYQLAKELCADGVHLKSTQFDDIEKAKALGLFVVISTHTLEEAIKAEALGADMVTFSPIFKTPNKGKPKGVGELKRVSLSLHIPLIALGGILSDEQVSLCEQHGAKGFASIRYFS